MPRSRIPAGRQAAKQFLAVIRQCLEKQYPGAVSSEVECSCGAPYHARLVPFRVQGEPAVAVIPEGTALTADDVREALRCENVERLQMDELESVFASLGSRGADALEAPDFPTVFLDESLLGWPELVFCPRMFLGKPGDCFRVPTRTFLDLSYAIVAPLTSVNYLSHDEWGV